jgi:hypothetical protein
MEADLPRKLSEVQYNYIYLWGLRTGALSKTVTGDPRDLIGIHQQTMS